MKSEKQNIFLLPKEGKRVRGLAAKPANGCLNICNA
jgi:hypothetical protein